MAHQQKATSVELADALLTEFIPQSVTCLRHLELGSDARAVMEAKAMFYGAAAVLMALLSEEEKSAGLFGVRAEIERRLAASADGGVQAFGLIRGAMKDLDNLLHPTVERRELRWALNWFSSVGVDVSNPADLTLVACFWMDYWTEAIKLLRSVEIVT